MNQASVHSNNTNLLKDLTPMVRKQRPWLRTEFALKSVPKADPGACEAVGSGEQRAGAEKVPEVKQAKNILSKY